LSRLVAQTLQRRPQQQRAAVAIVQKLQFRLDVAAVRGDALSLDTRAYKATRECDVVFMHSVLQKKWAKQG
jgi:hypothetical protein